MKRDIYQKLIDWKNSNRRKPLILKGARQTGKTYILKEFGKNEFRNFFYFNFEEDPLLKSFFESRLTPKKIIEKLSIYQKKEINPVSDLIIFDEIQFSNNALNSLKYFYEEANEYYIVAAGSLLGIKLSSPKSFPVGKVNFLNLFPMTFFEFLDALGESKYRNLIEEKRDLTPIDIPFHEDLIELLKKYYYIGGMPEVVKCYAETKSFVEIRNIQKEIISSYSLDFAKHAPSSEITKLTLIWDSISSQLARENKKFIFSAIKKSARARDYEDAIIWLEDAGLIYRAFSVSSSRPPLRGYMNRGDFKVYAVDVGLLGAMANISVDILALQNNLFKEYKGAFVENFVASQLKANFDCDLFYWKSDGKKAEVDFLCEIQDKIYPLEVKAGINPKSKSLKSYDNQFSPPILIRSTLLNFKLDGRICNIPLYSISNYPYIISACSRL